MTTTQSIEGRQISQYLRIVSAGTISGVNLFRDFGASSRNLVDGRPETYERELDMARGAALAELYQRAEAMGTDAVADVDTGYEVLGVDNGMSMVTASGTAVTLI